MPKLSLILDIILIITGVIVSDSDLLLFAGCVVLALIAAGLEAVNQPRHNTVRGWRSAGRSAK